MGFLVACKNEEDPIKNGGARVVTTLLITFSDAQGQLTLKSVMESCRNSNSSELLWLVLFSAKMKVLEWSQHFSHYKSMGIFQDAQGQLTHKSLVQSCRILNPFQLTPKSVMESCGNSNLCDLLWLALLSARMKKINLKIKVLEWSQHFSHYKSMGTFPDAEGQLTHKALVQSCWISNLLAILWLHSLPARIQKNQSKMKELEWSQGFPHYYPTKAICYHINQSSNPI